ncbi:unnamed protein product [Diamesa serratosioi]
MHPAVEPISFLIGTWKSISAKGIFPTINDFSYSEELVYESIGQPVLNYKSVSRLGDRPAHLESGFLRIVPGTNRISTLGAHNFGITVIAEGTFEEKTLSLQSTEISRMSSAKEPKVVKIMTTIKLIGEGKLEILTDMATDNTGLTNHLHVIYKKQ